MQLLFYLFSTLMALEDRLRLKLKVKTEISLCMAIMLDHAPMAIPIYTVLPYCVIHSTTVLCDIPKLLCVHECIVCVHIYTNFNNITEHLTHNGRLKSFAYDSVDIYTVPRESWIPKYSIATMHLEFYGEAHRVSNM